MLEVAIEFAIMAHSGQRDLVGEPYVLHPLRVMLQMPDPESKIVAVLHDVLEDGDFTRERLLQAGIGERLVAIVEMLTRRPDEKYPEYIERVAAHGWARAVKLADLNDNLDPNRIHALYQSEKHSRRSIERRLAKYLKAWSALKEHE